MCTAATRPIGRSNRASKRGVALGRPSARLRVATGFIASIPSRSAVVASAVEVVPRAAAASPR